MAFCSPTESNIFITTRDPKKQKTLTEYSAVATTFSGDPPKTKAQIRKEEREAKQRAAKEEREAKQKAKQEEKEATR